MRKILFFLMIVCWISACAGNPPAWWNPGNVYSNPSKSSVPAPTVLAPQPTDEPALEEPQEESFSVQEENYEEMTLPPVDDLEEAEPTEEEPALQPSILEE